MVVEQFQRSSRLRFNDVSDLPLTRGPGRTKSQDSIPSFRVGKEGEDGMSGSGSW